MPSKFEPGGIVQHEFFVASTPVIAHKTGGLKDTVIDFDFQNMKGSGCAFNRYTVLQFYLFFILLLRMMISAIL